MEKGEHFDLLVGMQIGAATVKSSMEISQKTKMNLPFDPVIPFLDVSEGTQNTNLKENKHSHVHCSVI